MVEVSVLVCQGSLRDQVDGPKETDGHFLQICFIRLFYRAYFFIIRFCNEVFKDSDVPGKPHRLELDETVIVSHYTLFSCVFQLNWTRLNCIG